jgi:hypothetical protein
MERIPILTFRIDEEPEPGTVVNMTTEVRDFEVVAGGAEGEQVVHIQFILWGMGKGYRILLRNCKGGRNVGCRLR